MEVQKISRTAQKFNGVTYYLCGAYFQRKGKRLHRAVWEYHNGEIPKGYHVHHKDGDTGNNEIENLTLMEGYKHLSEHMSTPERRAESAACIGAAREAARVWHGSEEGAAFHARLGRENWEKRKLQTYSCSYCGEVFQTKFVYPKDTNHFCHPNCRASYRRRRISGESKGGQESGDGERLQHGSGGHA